MHCSHNISHGCHLHHGYSHHSGSHCCASGTGHRRFVSREETVKQLEEYLEQLKSEQKGVEEYIEQLNAEEK